MRKIKEIKENKESNKKNKIKRFIDWLWKSDSLLSYIVNLLIIFILVKFVFYPAFGAINNTSMPVVAVMSSSMEHHLPFEDWWDLNHNFYEEKGITKDQFMKFPLRDGFNKGDVIVVKGVKENELKVGDVIIFISQNKLPIIHRIVGIREENGQRIFETKGDNNKGQIVNPFINEKYITYDQIVGKAVFRIPYLGYPKVWLSEILKFLS